MLRPSGERTGLQGKVLGLLGRGLRLGTEVVRVARGFVYRGKTDVVGLELDAAGLLRLLVETLVARFELLGEDGVIFDLLGSPRLVFEELFGSG